MGNALECLLGSCLCSFLAALWADSATSLLACFSLSAPSAFGSNCTVASLIPFSSFFSVPCGMPLKLSLVDSSLWSLLTTLGINYFHLKASRRQRDQGAKSRDTKNSKSRADKKWSGSGRRGSLHHKPGFTVREVLILWRLWRHGQNLRGQFN